MMKRTWTQMLWCVTIIFPMSCTVGALANNPPAIVFSSLLSGLQMQYDTGLLTLDRIKAVDLPDVKSDNVFAYNPATGAKLWAMLSARDGKPLARFDFYASKLSPTLWLLASYDLNDPQTHHLLSSRRLKLAEGSYTLDFFLASGRFYTFPFAVSVTSSANDDGPERYYFLEGDWASWAYLFYAAAEPEQGLVWRMWLRNKEPVREKNVEVKIEVRRGNAVVAMCRPATHRLLTASWARHDFDLVAPMNGTAVGAYLKAGDILRRDGDYTLAVQINDVEQGVWKFRVADGKFTCVGRTDRTNTDPLTFIEGDGEAWWYCAETAPPPQSAASLPPESRGQAHDTVRWSNRVRGPSPNADSAHLRSTF